MKHRIALADGRTFETELDAFNPLLRWWRWTEYRLRPYPFEKHADHCDVAWCDDPLAEHRVLPLGYPDALRGRVLVWVEDGRFVALTPHTLFPIADTAAAVAGASEAHARALESCAEQPSLF